MSAPDAGPAPSIVDRLSESRVDLRSDLGFSRLLSRGEPFYVIRDPVTFKSHRVSAREYKVLTRIRSERTLSEAFEDLAREGVLHVDDRESFFQFVLSLHRLGLLRLPVSDEKSLYERHLAARKASRKKWLSAVFFLNVPLFNPDAFLERTIRVARIVFSRGFFVAWAALVVSAILIAARSWSELTAPLTRMAAAENLPLVFATLIGLKVLHELGHAYACKHFGGRVPEMGVYLIVLAPCAYVDTSSAWGFPRKWQRVAVCLAGMYVELFVAALAMLVWSTTESETWKAAAYNVALLASVVTVGFNINPLMRFDGYYALSDLVEIPNLRARATRYLGALTKRFALGLPMHESRVSRRMGCFLASFGLASSVYKLALVLTISAVIAHKFFALGLVLATTYVLLEVGRILRRALPLLFTSAETAGVRARAVALGLGLFVLLPAGLMSVPVPMGVDAPATLTAEREVLVRAPRAGFLREVPAPATSRVEIGDELLLLEDCQAHYAVLETELELEQARHELRLAQVDEPLRVPQARRRLEVSEDAWRRRQAELEELRVRAEIPGRLVETLEPTDLGRFVLPGESVARIVSGKPMLRALLTASQIAQARPALGTEVVFRPRSAPELSLAGTVVRVEPRGSRTIEARSLTQLGGGDIAVDPESQAASSSYFELAIELADTDRDLPHGITGRVRFDGTAEPLARRGLRKFLRFVGRLQHGL